MTQPTLSPLYAEPVSIGGPAGQLLQGLIDQWLLMAPKANPAMLEIFADRDSRPFRSLLPWSGEFAGKYLTSAVQVYRLTRDPRLLGWLGEFVNRLISLQDQDGYLGPWPEDSRLTNFSPYHGSGEAVGDPKQRKGLLTWDTWGHYHIMTGLMLWYEETGDPQSLNCACRMADLLCRKYLGKKKIRLVDTGSTEMNLAPAHSLARLYRLTKEERYLALSLQIVDEFSAVDDHGPLAGNYLDGPLAGKAFFQLPKPRWESLHPIMALAELFWITGDQRYLTAFERIWWTIVEYDRHNNGGFSSGEQATGNPYDPAPIETCCTIAWLALSVEMLKLTRQSIVADEIEFSTLNSVLGMHSPTGRWATYNTPSEGACFASAHWIVFQSRSGSPELNCCSVNSPRGLGLISEWGLMQDDRGLVLNYYGPARFCARLAGGQEIEIIQETDYPVSGRIVLQVNPTGQADLSLYLRIPYWSADTRLSLNGQPLEGPQPGSYYEIKREWKQGDQVELHLDLAQHFWRGEQQCQGLTSIYRCPLLLAYDQRYNRDVSKKHKALSVPDDYRNVTGELLAVPALEAGSLSPVPVEWKEWHPPLVLVQAKTSTGQPIYLCDFASAGMTGTLYQTWLPVLHASQRTAAFSRQNPLRSTRER